MVSPEVVSLVVYAGSVVGSLARAIIPYLRKLKEAEEAGVDAPQFQKRYVFTAVLAVVLSSVVGVLLYPTLVTQVGADAALSGIFVYAFIAGFGSVALFNEILATTGFAGTSKETITPIPTEPPK
jgi:uncharacterized membrane protein YadS